MMLPIGSQFPLHLLITLNGVGVVSQTPTVVLQRLSDLTYWNGTTGFSGTITAVPLIEVDSVNQPGLYSKTFNQSVDTSGAQTYTAYYLNTNVSHLDTAVEELVFTNIAAQVNTIQIASAVASKILLNPAIPINSADIASNCLLSNVDCDVDYIRNNMALESTLLSGLNVIENDLNTIISIIQPLAGSNEITFVFTDQNSLPIPGVKVTVKNTTSQITLAVGVSDTNGNLVLGLPVGTFNLLFFKSFVSFPTQPVSLIVTANATVPIACVTFQPVAPTANLCAAFLYLVDAAGQPIPNVMVRCKVIDNFPFSGGATMLTTKGYQNVISDATGYIQMNMIIGAYYEISSPELFLTVTDFLVPNQASLDISTLLPQSS